jgi:CBS domain-containing protein
MSSPTQNSERFLDAFRIIERHLRDSTNRGKGEGFYTLVDLAARSDSAVRHYREDLKEFADLRNAIIHERGGGRVIAEPNAWAMERIEGIASILTDPPKVIPLFQFPVYTLTPRDSLAEAVSVMLVRSFSQIPIYDSDTFQALLTANTITRWLGAQIEEDIFSLAETRTEDVLRFTEDEKHCTFLGRKATLFDALDCFQSSAATGTDLEAILITHSGAQDQKALGIITIWDLPKIHQELKP